MARGLRRKRSATQERPSRDVDADRLLVRSYFDGHASHVSGQVKRVVADVGLRPLATEILGARYMPVRRAFLWSVAAALVLGFTVGLDKGALTSLPTTDPETRQAQPDSEFQAQPGGVFGSPLPERPKGTPDDEAVEATITRGHGQTSLWLASSYSDSKGTHVQVMLISSRLPGSDLLLTAEPGQHDIPRTGEVTLSTGLTFSWIHRDTPGIDQVGSRELVFSFRRPDGATTTTSGRFPVEDALAPMTPSELEELERELIKLSLRKVS